MNFGKKLRSVFLEDVGDDIPIENLPEYQEPINVETPSNIDDGMIAEIYENHGLSDLSKSIFKVEDIIQSLPKEMPTDVKKASVSSILMSFQLSLTDLLSDGLNRRDILVSVLNALHLEAEKTVSEKENEIEEYKKKISDLEDEIYKIREEMKFSKETIDLENSRIDKLVKFMEGGE